MSRKTKPSRNDTTSKKTQPVARTSSEKFEPSKDTKTAQRIGDGTNFLSDAREKADEYNPSVDPEVIKEAKLKAIDDAANKLEMCITGYPSIDNYNAGNLINIWEFAKSVNAEDILRYAPSENWEKLPPSVLMLIALINLGVSIKGIDNAGIANKLFDLIISRQIEGLSTPKQIRVLLNHGFLNAGTWSKGKAQEMISYLVDNHWKIPEDIDPETY